MTHSVFLDKRYVPYVMSLLRFLERISLLVRYWVVNGPSYKPCIYNMRLRLLIHCTSRKLYLERKKMLHEN